MPVKGMGPVRSKLKATFEKIANEMTEQTVTEILIVGGGYADALTPVDLGTLVNSRFRRVQKIGDGWSGQYGYTAEYAGWVHNMPGTLRGKPRDSVDSFNTKEGKTGFASDSGNFWDSALGPGQGEPQWLVKGFERDGLDDIKAVIKRNMQL